jgi:hypothetical protein
MRLRKVFFTVILPALLFGCASTGVYLSQGTLLLGEVDHVLTPEQVAADQLAPNQKMENLDLRIRKWGFTNEQVASGRVVVVREGIYWNNVVSGIKRDMLRAALVPKGMTVAPGNIVEGVEGDADAPYTLSRIRANNAKEGDCYYDELPTGLAKGLMGAMSKVGPSGAATLYCKGIEKEGWQRPRTYWHKPPAAAPSAK